VPNAPNRGHRKCETCIHFTDKRDEWKDKYVVHPHRNNYSAAGYCEWKCPPIMARILWGEWSQRTVALDDWCHCWEDVTGVSILSNQLLIGSK
jgi:hypothetical protein